jgi:hypothetical protein
MNTRFRVDLLHPGVELRPGIAKDWQEWFLGPGGVRRLALVGLGFLVVLVVVLVATILPSYFRLSSSLGAVPGLRRDLAARESDLGLLRSNLGALGGEARRQIRWGELLGTLSQQTPPGLRLQVVEVTGAGPAAPGQAAPAESLLRIQSVTPLRPGSPPLLEVAQFMAGLMRDPAVSKRFQLRSWEIKPDAGGQLLNITILLAERPQ